MKVRSAEFIKSAFQEADWPADLKPEIAFLGRSNVGKSSLINSLLGVAGLARTSSTPGRTQALNFFEINGVFRFVDVPGYGYARVPKNIRSSWGFAPRTHKTGFATSPVASAQGKAALNSCHEIR
jgi:GTP-binding protein